MKKKMYYNMRIKTLKRNTTNINRKGKDAFLARKNALNLSLTALVRQQKDLERVLHALEHRREGWGEKLLEGLGSDASDAGTIKKKLKLLKEAVETKTQEIEGTEHMMTTIKSQVVA